MNQPRPFPAHISRAHACQGNSLVSRDYVRVRLKVLLRRKTASLAKSLLTLTTIYNTRLSKVRRHKVAYNDTRFLYSSCLILIPPWLRYCKTTFLNEDPHNGTVRPTDLVPSAPLTTPVLRVTKVSTHLT